MSADVGVLEIADLGDVTSDRSLSLLIEGIVAKQHGFDVGEHAVMARSRGPVLVAVPVGLIGQSPNAAYQLTLDRRCLPSGRHKLAPEAVVLFHHL